MLKDIEEAKKYADMMFANGYLELSSHFYKLLSIISQQNSDIEALVKEREYMVRHLREVQEKHKRDTTTYFKTVSDTCGLIADEIEKGYFKDLYDEDESPC